MTRYTELVCGVLSPVAGGLALGIYLFAPINSTNSATEAYRQYSAVDAGLSPLQVALISALAFLYAGVVVGSVLDASRTSHPGRLLLRISGLLLVPVTVATGAGGLYVFSWAALLALVSVAASFVSTAHRPRRVRAVH